MNCKKNKIGKKEIINIIQEEVGNCDVYIGTIETGWNLALARILVKINNIFVKKRRKK